MSKRLVVNSSLPPNVGNEYYLVEYYGQRDHVYKLHRRPQTTNISGEERVIGFLGETNNRGREALGKIKVLWTKRRGDSRNNMYVIQYEEV